MSVFRVVQFHFCIGTGFGNFGINKRVCFYRYTKLTHALGPCVLPIITIVTCFVLVVLAKIEGSSSVAFDAEHKFVPFSGS